MHLQPLTEVMRNLLFNKRLLTALMGLWQVSFLFAQDGYIKGKITNGNENLPAATVSLGTKTILSNSKGEFSFSAEAGSYTLVITHAGYKKIEEPVSVKAGITQILNYILSPAEQMGQVVVLGSRSVIQHSNLNTPVPVDVFSSVHLEQTGQISLTQMLNLVAPSFNTSREILNEPATLRGLDPDHTLILINGIRYHNMVWLFGGGLKGQLGRGSVGNDLNSIPFSAIEKVEILRDGASAQYGSDAIAGVINIQLKKTTGKTSIQLHTGQFYKGDGEKFSIGINRGISLNKKGFLDFSASYRYQAPTFRGEEYAGTVYKNYPANASNADSSIIKAQDDSIINEKGFNRKAVIDNAGNLKLISKGFLINGGYTINNHTEVFWTAGINGRKIERGAAYRFPKNPSQVNLALYPDGFQAISKPNTVDVSVIAGIKGETKNNWHWDFSSSYGNNSVNSYVTNTNNASQSYLGANAPTSFYTGKDLYKQLTNDINFAKSYFRLPWQMKTLNLGWGAEWRLENYHTKAGEETSWKNYDLTGRTQGGSQGTSGWDPKYVVNKNRNVWGAYIDLEAECTNHFLFNAAARYEYYSDFGSNIAAKLAARYQFSDKLTIRASVNNGFRAPSLQQRYMNSVQTAFINSGGVLIPALRGSFPNDHDVIKALGIPLLTAEKTINISGGFTSTISNRIVLMVDAYWIQIKDRIVLSGTFDRSIPAVRKILDSIPGVRVDQVQFFTNAINTRTKGIDIVLDGNWNNRKAGLNIRLAANFTSTHLFGDIKTSDKLPADSLNTNALFNIEDKARMEKGQPADKIILSVTYKRGKTALIIRNTRFGRTTIAPLFRNPTRILYESFSPKILIDISVSYSLKTWVTLTLGADNVFNVYPDHLKNYENTVQGSWTYSPEASPFGFNGGYYYVSLAFKW
jgi:iron complex outermembrane receptor protein